MGSICSNCAKGVVFDPLMPGIDTEVYDPIQINESTISFGRKAKSNNFDYHVVEQISSNEFYVKSRNGSKKYFMKTYPLLKMSEKQNSQISRELRILKSLKDENNFIRIHETVRHGEQLCVLYADLPNCLHDFVLDERKKCHNNSELFEDDSHRRSQYLERVKFIFFDLLCIVEKIHRLGIYHFNLHPKNIRFGKSGELILSGFEKSRHKRYVRIKNVFSNFRRRKTKRSNNNSSKSSDNGIRGKELSKKLTKREKEYLKKKISRNERECLYHSEDESCFYPERVRRVEKYIIDEGKRRKKRKRRRKNNQKGGGGGAIINDNSKYDNDICDGDFVDRYAMACILYFMVTNGCLVKSLYSNSNKGQVEENDDEEEDEEEEDDTEADDVRPKSTFSEEEEDDDDDDDDLDDCEDSRVIMRGIKKKMGEMNEGGDTGVYKVMRKLINAEKDVDLKDILEDEWLKK